ncbi:MAG TPA: TonB-dependent receptor plug domain-containing protein, partial [candidate division Zixibacteria bacterium]|nr:TonB-dependent receptor plug domain-containing protein [candidate division Zixibacteria bacterium]
MRQGAPTRQPGRYQTLLRTTALLFFITATTTVAATWERSGRVIDDQGQPLAGASIVTDIPNIGAITDPQGRFTLNGANATPVRITVSHVGYRPLLIDLTSFDPATDLALTLERIVIQEQGITVYANRARTGETPIAYSDITAGQIERDYTVGDLPLALNSAPNVHIWTDAGSQLGYSHIAIRGFDERRISTYVNGVPLNDPEDHVTYFVDLPDFTNNVRDIQIQRGVGASLYADGAFGGSINVVSYALDQPRRFRLSAGIGEYWDRHSSDWVGQTNRQTLEFSSGLIDGRYHLLARLSRQWTGGYVQNSWAHGRSYFLSASRLDPKSTTTFNAYGGPIRTHAAWDGIDLDTYRADRRANFLTYANEGDNFNQPHYQLHNSYQLSVHALLSS